MKSDFLCTFDKKIHLIKYDIRSLSGCSEASADRPGFVQLPFLLGDTLLLQPDLCGGDVLQHLSQHLAQQRLHLHTALPAGPRQKDS